MATCSVLEPNRCYTDPTTGQSVMWTCSNGVLTPTTQTCTPVAPIAFAGILALGFIAGGVMLLNAGGTSHAHRSYHRSKHAKRDTRAHHHRRTQPYEKVVRTTTCYRNGRRVSCHRG